MNGLEISIPVETEVLGIWLLILFLFEFGMQEKQDQRPERDIATLDS